MAAMDRFSFWAGKYESGHTPWDLGQVSDPVLDLQRRHFPAGGDVLVPACGRGHEAVFLAGKGYRVTAVDFVAAPLGFLAEAAAAAEVEIEIVQEDVLALPQTFAARFDAILEQACLIALRPRLWPAYEAMAHRVLRPGGRLLGVFMEAEIDRPPPYSVSPRELKTLFPAGRWQAGGPWPQPRDPRRPGPEYTASFTKLS